MEYTPSISVIIPVYKAEKYLHRCVDSFLKQTFSDFEVLLIDDGSPDNSGKICDAYSVLDKRIRVFHKTNGGVSSARQYGLDYAEGEYVIHADPDDWVEPTMLEELYQNAIQNNADMVICDFYVVNYNKVSYIEQRPKQLTHEVVLKDMFDNLHGSCCNKLIKRILLKKWNIKFPASFTFCEDLFFNCSLLLHNIKITYLPKAFYYYDQSINNNSLVKTYSSETYNRDVQLLSSFITLFKDDAYLQELAKNKFSYLIIKRAFLSGIFSSSEFKKLCSKYKCYVFHEGKNKFSWLLYFSCEGLYSVAYNIYKIYNKMSK